MGLLDTIRGIQAKEQSDEVRVPERARFEDEAPRPSFKERVVQNLTGLVNGTHFRTNNPWFDKNFTPPGGASPKAKVEKEKARWFY